MIKVLFIAYYFPPAGSIGVQRTIKFIKSLPEEGFLPVVVGGLAEDSPAPRDSSLAPRDSSLVAKIPAAVPVFHVEGPAPRPRGRLRRVLERWLWLPSSLSRWWIRTATELGCRVGNDARLIYATMSPFQSADVAYKISKRLGIPWVADLRDPWALDEYTIYPTLLHRKLDQFKMERLLSTAALIIMNTPEATKALKEAFPRLPAKSVLTITNGFDPDDFARAVAARGDSKFRIVSAGGLSTGLELWLRRRRLYRFLGGAVRGVDFLASSPLFLLRALEAWSERRPEIVNDLEVVFAGNLSQADRTMTNRSEISRLVRFPGYLPHLKSLELIRTADLLFFTMHTMSPGERPRTIQAKIYEYMASGRPILAAVPDGDVWDFLGQYGKALLCHPGDVEAMVQQLDKAYNAWKNGRPIGLMNKDFVEQFESHRLTAKLAQAFRELLTNHGSQVARISGESSLPVEADRI
jgi:glycosyltransferase involved in cell wall biosynthesis